MSWRAGLQEEGRMQQFRELLAGTWGGTQRRGAVDSGLFIRFKEAQTS